MLEGKLTLPVLHVLNKTDDPWVKEIAADVKRGTATAEEIMRLVAFTKANGGIDYAFGVMDEYKEKAVS